jgi:hypothetical protein
VEIMICAYPQVVSDDSACSVDDVMMSVHVLSKYVMILDVEMMI